VNFSNITLALADGEAHLPARGEHEIGMRSARNFAIGADHISRI